MKIPLRRIALLGETVLHTREKQNYYSGRRNKTICTTYLFQKLYKTPFRERCLHLFILLSLYVSIALREAVLLIYSLLLYSVKRSSFPLKP